MGAREEHLRDLYMQKGELEYQLRLAQLELMKAGVLRELAETDAAGLKASLAEQKQEIDRLHRALKAIAPYVERGVTPGAQAVRAILREVGL